MKTIKKIALILTLALSSAAAQAYSFGDFKFEENSTLPMVYMNIVSDVGAVTDPSHKLGLANVAGEMFLRGTKTKSKLEILRTLDRLGASIAVDIRPEGTVFRIATLSDNLDEVLALLTEIFTEPAFQKAELEKLKKEVIGGILAEKSRDAQLATRHFQKFLFGSHPYSNPVMGIESGVSAITIDDITRYYSGHFGKNTLALLGSGDAESGKLKKWWNDLNSKLGKINPKAGPSAPMAKPSIPPGRRSMLVNKPKATQSQVLIGHAGPRPEEDGFYALTVANHAFGGPSFEARLMQEIREKRGWTYGASNSIRFGREPKYYSMYFFPKTADTIPAAKLAIQMFEDLVANGVTKAEFDHSKGALVNRAPFDYDTPRKRLENATNELLYDFPEDFFRNLATNISRTTHEESTAAVKKFFHPENLSALVLGDGEALKAGMKTLPGFGAPEVKYFLKD